MAALDLIVTASPYPYRINAFKAFSGPRDNFWSRLVRIGDVEKIAGPGQAIRRQLVRVGKAFGCSKNGDPLIKIESGPVETLDFTAGQPAAVRNVGRAEISPELRHGRFLGEPGQGRIETAEDAIAADAGTEGVLRTLRSDEQAIPDIVMGSSGDIVFINQWCRFGREGFACIGTIGVGHQGQRGRSIGRFSKRHVTGSAIVDCSDAVGSWSEKKSVDRSGTE